MATAGLGKEYGFDAAAGGERFFSEANAFDADGAGLGGQAAAKGDPEFLEPAILAGGDDGACRASRFARVGHDGRLANFVGAKRAAELLREERACDSVRAGSGGKGVELSREGRTR
ncbi:MAG: hypothetical protein NVS9B14_10800 [Candidatus Acidiferrum sp.]